MWNGRRKARPGGETSPDSLSLCPEAPPPMPYSALGASYAVKKIWVLPT